MALRIPLQPGLPHYTIQAELDGTTFTFEFRWNARAAAWFMHLQDAEGVHLVSGVRVVVNWPLVSRYKGEELPAGTLMAIDTSGELEDPGLTDLGARVQLVYLTAAEG